MADNISYSLKQQDDSFPVAGLEHHVSIVSYSMLFNAHPNDVDPSLADLSLTSSS